MRWQRTCAGLAAAALGVLGVSGVAGATHSRGGSSGPPHDFSSGSLRSTLPFFGNADVHVRFTAHLPPTQPQYGSFDGRGEALMTIEESGERRQHRGDFLCGFVSGHRAALLFLLREPVMTQSGPVRHMVIMPFDNGGPNDEPPDEVAFALNQYLGPPPEESRSCSGTAMGAERTHGNVVVHDSAG